MGNGISYNQNAGRIYTDDTVQSFKSYYEHPEPIRKRCDSCGHKISGENHNDGEHHMRKKRVK